MDDNACFRELLVSLLGPGKGIRCERDFACAETALAVLDQEPPPDVILLDVNLGDRNGVDAIQPIRERAPATRVLMLTTFFDTRAHALAIGAGASGFLLKSYSLQEIVARVHQASRASLAGEAGLLASCNHSVYAKASHTPVIGSTSLHTLPEFGHRQVPHTEKGLPLQSEGSMSARRVVLHLKRGLSRFRCLLNATGLLFAGQGAGRD